MDYTEAVRQNVLDAIAGYRLVTGYQESMVDMDFVHFQMFLDDLEHGDFEFALGLVSLVKILLHALERVTGGDADTILSAIGESAVSQ